MRRLKEAKESILTGIIMLKVGTLFLLSGIEEAVEGEGEGEEGKEGKESEESKGSEGAEDTKKDTELYEGTPRGEAPEPKVGKGYKIIKKEAPVHEEEEPKDPTIAKYKAIVEEAEELGKGKLKLKEKIDDSGAEIAKDFMNNAYENTVGYVRAKFHNWKTRREVKKNPEEAKEKRLHILVPGLVQNEGAMRKLAKQIEERGDLAYIARAKHGITDIKSIEERSENIYEAMDTFKEKTGMSDEEFKKMKKTLVGHSSGADVGYFIAGDERAREKYGIEDIVAIAGTGGGIEMRTPIQRAFAKLVPSAKEDDPNTSRGARENIIKLYERKPKVPVYSVQSEGDRLINRKGMRVPYQHSANEVVIEGDNIGHFRTSGQHKETNAIVIDLRERMAAGPKGAIAKYNPEKEEYTVINKGQNRAKASEYYREAA